MTLDRDYEDMIICAMRYSIGRQTYIVSIACNYYGARISNWSTRSLVCVIRDIDDAYSLGNDRIDKPNWLKLRGMIYSELLTRNCGDELKLLHKFNIPMRCPHDR